jgi:putative tricarboxylic transport membrane protein
LADFLAPEAGGIVRSEIHQITGFRALLDTTAPGQALGFAGGQQLPGATQEKARMGFKNLQDFLAGLLFSAFGVAALYFGRTFQMGTSTKMGPGYLPTILGWSLVGIGLFITIRALFISGAPIPRISLRPQIFIIGALLAFAFLIERTGLLAAAATVVVLGSLASRDVRPLEMIVIAVITAFAAVGLFIKLLGQPMLPWTWGF